MRILQTITLLLFIGINANAQKYFTKEGVVSFTSKAPLEQIESINHKAASVFDSESGAIEWAVLIKAFKFEKALMQEHFNENYMESSKYPKAKFKGRILNLKDIDLSKDGTYPLKIKGTLNMHGVTQEIENEGTFVIVNGAIRGVSQFKVKVADYNISIPGVVADKIAKTVSINVRADYQVLN